MFELKCYCKVGVTVYDAALAEFDWCRQAESSRLGQKTAGGGIVIGGVEVVRER
jgi:ribosomal protein L27